VATACYTPTYLPASYKGVPFEAIEASSEHGRRGAVGEFPFGEDTAYADLGRKAATYSLRGRFVTNAHVLQSALLIAAVETPGSGPLVHPTRGILNVACTSLKVKDDVIEEQGVTYVDLEFVEANDWPGGLSFLGDILGGSIGTLLAAASVVFTIGYAAASLVPFHRSKRVFGTTASVVGLVRNEFARANTGSTSNKVIRALMDLDTIIGDEIRLRDPAVVSSAISAGIGAIVRQLPAADAYQALRRIANATATSSSLPGASGTTENAVLGYAHLVAGAYMAQTVIAQRFANAEEAFVGLSAVETILRDETRIAYDACQNELFLAIRDYLTSVQAQMFKRIYSLPGVVAYNFSASVHPLTAAYAIYGDAKRLRELEAGNLLSGTGRFDPVVVGVAA
jgi:hypothetical protein